MTARTLQRPIMILAGGTGGHIFPALAVARVLRARDVPVVWLGADGAMETRLVPQHGIELDTLAISGLRGKGALALLAAPIRVLRAIRAAGFVLRRRQPRAVVSFGGFAAGPGGVAARLMRTPLLVHEQNRAPGFTNRILARVARRVLTGFPGAFPQREEYVGNPVRNEIAALPAPRERLTGRQGPLRLLVLGGSQGARALNNALPRAIAALTGSAASVDMQVRHQCGEKLREEAMQAYADAGVEASVEAFIADMAAAYAWADLVVCRAGASTLAELCAAGVGSVLVPFAQAVDDHQTRNAEFLVERGAAVLLKQDEQLPERLQAVLRDLAGDSGRRLAMATAARDLAKVDAAERIADIILEEAGTGDRGPGTRTDPHFSSSSTSTVDHHHSMSPCLSLFPSPRSPVPGPGSVGAKP
ncbi:undecaprenyldiphospho-muramoylpentapeptide beta-N-acetylglucosaminyltransferase [Pseudoxanthomonas wuyuanensis]|uniref:UDP-N-acetylglucosamine--N-acetylmuramyl-(pentapeptide) pyrophosphoryl-undecaprenol N-acetylglucosamine transferase n=1 Tax=Pseudoxanthomonas wuyuanensis TaxID=1073196 RepID=A0A286DCG2_9GAMM|nr:undecaprenyldiphospho-muramoylpentapeptide beta-N-acetylglucosaminyltransferase [Pseudoxanthomonas wuyuanensis]SOD56323.1 UDP-N-acetylglucosamine-N-acetylmuramylpentapeptide N-acetylglucosamine transferase [Pseudoxanthomonas wuyuanensis]